jgi:hypothetical protein
MCPPTVRPFNSREGTVQMIVIGADTHKASHTVAAVREGTGRVVEDRSDQRSTAASPKGPIARPAGLGFCGCSSKVRRAPLSSAPTTRSVRQPHLMRPMPWPSQPANGVRTSRRGSSARPEHWPWQAPEDSRTDGTGGWTPSKWLARWVAADGAKIRRRCQALAAWGTRPGVAVNHSEPSSRGGTSPVATPDSSELSSR